MDCQLLVLSTSNIRFSSGSRMRRISMDLIFPWVNGTLPLCLAPQHGPLPASCSLMRHVSLARLSWAFRSAVCFLSNWETTTEGVLCQ